MKGRQLFAGQTVDYKCRNAFLELAPIKTLMQNDKFLQSIIAHVLTTKSVKKKSKSGLQEFLFG
jgi:hypothetical protein